MSRVVAAAIGALQEYQRRRIHFCGAPLPKMLRKSGELSDGGTFACTSRYCERCARHYQQTVFACTRAALQSTGHWPQKHAGIPAGKRPYMVTLTLQLPTGTGVAALRRNLSIVRKVRSRTHQTLRDHEYAWERFLHWSDRGAKERAKYWQNEIKARLPLPAASTDTLQKFCASWSGRTGFPPPTLDKTTYIWAIEVTAGQHNDRWHVHLHYLVPSRSDAERLNAAWQLNRGQRKFAQTHITGGPDESYGPGDDRDLADSNPAQYMTSYVSKAGLQHVPDGWRADAVQGLKDVRFYDAGGAWRPLGIGRDPSDDPVEWFVTGDGECIDPADYLAGRADEYEARGCVWAGALSGIELDHDSRIAYLETARDLLRKRSNATHGLDFWRAVNASLAQSRTSLTLADYGGADYVADPLEQLLVLSEARAAPD